MELVGQGLDGPVTGADGEPVLLADNRVTRRSSTGLVYIRQGANGPVYDFADPLVITAGKGPGRLGDASNALGAVGVAAAKYELIGDLKLVSDLAGQEAAATLKAMAGGARLVGNSTGVLSVAVDGYVGFSQNSPGAKMSASIGAGSLIAGLAIGGPVGAGICLAYGLAGLYINATVP